MTMTPTASLPPRAIASAAAFSPRPRPDAPMRLFCLPYAGGAASLFRDWPGRLRTPVEVVAVEPPGRGARFGEPALGDAHRLADALAEALLPWLDRPFALFGHSNGALMAFEIAHRLRDRGHLPALFFASAKNAPGLVDERSPLHALPRAAFLDALRERGGTPPEFFEHPDLVELYLPVLRADFSLSETYRYRRREPLATTLVTVAGRDDPCMGEDALLGWRREFHGPVSHHRIDGGHFFIDTHLDALAALIDAHLATALAAATARG